MSTEWLRSGYCSGIAPILDASLFGMFNEMIYCGGMSEASSTAAAGQTADQVALALRTRITAGLYLPGTPLRDAALAEEFDVSRNTLREALRVLRYDGLVHHQMHKGVVVRTLTPADVRDLYAARRATEVRAVQESSVADEDKLAHLEKTVLEAEHAVRHELWNEVGTASLAFHQALVALLGSPSLDAFFAGVLARLRLAFAVMADEGRFQAPWIPRDRQVWESLAAGRRGDAERYLRVYLDDSERIVLDVLRAQYAGHGTIPLSSGQDPDEQEY